MSTAVRGSSRRATWSAYVEAVRADAPFHAFVAVYAWVGLFACIAAGVPDKYAPLTYASLYLSYIVRVAGCAVIIGIGIWALRSRRPFANLRLLLGMARHPNFLAGLVLLGSVCIHMGVFTSLKTMLPDISPFHADHMLADFDEALHGGPPWRYTTALLPPEATALICPLYFGVWGLLVPSVLLACLFVPRLRAVRAQYLWTHLIVWPLLGNIVAGWAMSAGPMFYGLVTGDTMRFAELLRYLKHFPPLGDGAAYLWQAYVSGRPAVATGISAFPSLHVANATMFVLLAARIGRGWMWAAIAFCVFVLAASVHLAWHYAIDGYFSIAATLLLWCGVGRLLRWFGRRRDLYRH